MRRWLLLTSRCAGFSSYTSSWEHTDRKSDCPSAVCGFKHPLRGRRILPWSSQGNTSQDSDQATCIMFLPVWWPLSVSSQIKSQQNVSVFPVAFPSLPTGNHSDLALLLVHWVCWVWYWVWPEKRKTVLGFKSLWFLRLLYVWFDV